MIHFPLPTSFLTSTSSMRIFPLQNRPRFSSSSNIYLFAAQCKATISQASILPSRPNSYRWGALTSACDLSLPSVSKPINVDVFQSKWKTIRSTNFNYQPIQMPTSTIPKLKHGLDRVLFNPGAHFLQDPRSFLYNFDPYLQKIIQPNEINFDTFSPYVISSRDEKLLKLAKTTDCRFFSSTSSMTGVLSQLHFLLTGPKKLNLGRLTSSFADSPDTFTRLTRMPCSIFLRKVGDHYSVDADKTLDYGENVLSLLGRSMESMLTETRQEFQSHLKKAEQDQLKKPIEKYFIGKAGKFLLRAQLDCYDPRLPRKVFDLKSRAAFPIRMDSKHHEAYLRYQISRNHGLLASFEREYFDMLRSAFLKYCFQVRIGQMDGIFVTYHNTARIFGFQYIPLEELDEGLFGSTRMGEKVFSLGLQLLQEILETVVERHPKAPLLRLTFDTERMSAVYIEEVLDATENTHYQELLNGGTSVARLQLPIVNLVNKKPVPAESPLEVGPKDFWDIRYNFEYQSPDDQILMDYFRVRKTQATLLAKARDASRSIRVQKEAETGNISEKELERLERSSKKIYLYPRLGFPVGKHGLVVDDGWNL